MANLTLSPVAKQQFFDDDGNIIPGGKLFCYAAGTSTKKNTYTDVLGAVANTNPIILDNAGRVPSGFYLLPSSYKFILAPANDTDPPASPIWTMDNVGAVPTTDIDNDVTGTAGEAMTAGQAAYLSDGSGGLVAGRWYLADADQTYSSTAPVIAVVVGDVAAGATTTFRLSGRVTGLVGLVAGTSYYLSATAGAVTSTAPTNARFIGQADSITTLIVTPDPPISPSLVLLVDPKIKSLCDGRLTLTSGVPVTTSDVTAAGTLYFTPYVGNQIGLYNGTRWQQFTFAQLSIAVPAVATQVYDVFVDYNSGTPALALTAWTNDTTRATALTRQDGILVLTGTLGKRYVGTVRTVTASQLNDSFALRHVWNYYHRVLRPMRVVEATASWTYDAAAFHQANASAANQLDFVRGVEEDEVFAHVTSVAESTSGNVTFRVGIGLGSTTVNSATTFAGAGPITISDAEGVWALYEGFPGIGRRTLVWLEAADGGGGTFTWFSGGGSYANSGIIGRLFG